MKKYIIKNCPNYWYINRAIPECGLTYKVSGFKGETETSKYCKDVDDCLLKQIVEKCRDFKKPLYEINNGDGTISAYYSSNKDLSLADDILNILLEIEEVNE